MKLKYFILFVIFYAGAIHFAGCGGSDSVSDDPTDVGSTASTDLVEDQPDKDLSIQEYNLAKRKRQTKNRFPGDTIDLIEAVIKSYPKGSYLVKEDIPNSSDIPPAAVIYRSESSGKLVFALIATSREGMERDRLIEIKNVIGYDQSFIDYDSTRLGTALFFMTGFQTEGRNFTRLWEKYTPSHGGFRALSMQNWAAKNIPYVKVDFYFQPRNSTEYFNYFFVDGFKSKPHLLLTYEGVNQKRIMTDANGDKYPDYIEFVYRDNDTIITLIDTVTYIWMDSLYVNTRYPEKVTRY
ncbi:MAG: hypothetical protein LC102_00990 [Ignavibacteriales bacterium]|jgi:hypothetical protein|nr:MAG: hypothetical protein F9K26_03290 [Ignavibacteriaceae bacterium]MBW7872458.1 hypothetical protein [Ignavibacteria bacterium]MCZ2141989.1 hypothetical protein [Ignavibacteriales bacterium]OQY79690.1 MAG: hypothetical protein B6D45_00435 [Ignavibacteriales bacterium UTCHB3]MBV6445155.1 hypothetical protein [Ignavibacteriaceae bacterium]